jgi:predicted RNA binding protein YcfA (HicA-like mRNA interferase family)
MIPVLKPEDVIKSLETMGFIFIKQHGSHRKYKKGKHTVIVPMHYEVAKGTLRSILEQAGLSIDELMKYI